MDHTIIKEAATKIVANIKAMEDDITVLRNKQDIISTSDTTMTGSYPGRLSIEEIGGKSEQANYAGNNLFDTNKTTIGYITDDGTINSSVLNVMSDYISLGEEGLTLSVNQTLTSIGVAYYDENKTYLSRKDNFDKSEVVISKSNSVGYIRVWFNIDNTAIGDRLLSLEPMLNVGTVSLPYEPYTGGQPSPNPDYPQEIKKTVVSEIKTHGKNLIKNTATSWTNNGVTYVINNDGSIIANGTASAESHVTINAKVNLIGKKVVLNGCPSGGSFNTYRIQINGHSGPSSYVCDMGEGVTIIPTHVIDYVTIYIASGATVSNLIFKPMIREASVEDPTYEPYTESTITLSQPIELYGIGDVQDTIEDGKVVRRFAEVLLNGTDSEKWTLGGTESGQNLLIQYAVTDIKRSDKSLCNQFSHTDLYTSNNIIGYSTNSASNCIRFRPSDYESITLSDWKSRLQSNPMTVVYELATPVIEDLPVADQMALNSLKTFDGITYVEIDSEIEPTFKAEYGVTKLGGYTLEGILAGANGVSLGQSNTDRITALEATLVNNI